VLTFGSGFGPGSFCQVFFFFFFFFESSLYTAADWRQGAVSLVLRIQKMFMVTTGADRAKYAGCM
jgi:hypothetical protein